jgi:hypothetical protein
MGFVMGDAAETLELTYAQYLSLEAETGARHEWLGGRVYAMAGGSPEHALQASASWVPSCNGWRGRAAAVWPAPT